MNFALHLILLAFAASGFMFDGKAIAQQLISDRAFGIIAARPIDSNGCPSGLLFANMSNDSFLRLMRDLRIDLSRMVKQELPRVGSDAWNGYKDQESVCKYPDAFQRRQIRMVDDLRPWNIDQRTLSNYLMRQLEKSGIDYQSY